MHLVCVVAALVAVSWIFALFPPARLKVRMSFLAPNAAESSNGSPSEALRAQKRSSNGTAWISSLGPSATARVGRDAPASPMFVPDCARRP
jgi:hypothetical protein